MPRRQGPRRGATATAAVGAGSQRVFGEQVPVERHGTVPELAYGTIIGIHFIRGEKNQTRTLMDVVVYDVRSRALLFRGGGESVVQGHAAPVGLGGERRKQSEIGFERATEDLIPPIAMGSQVAR